MCRRTFLASLSDPPWHDDKTLPNRPEFVALKVVFNIKSDKNHTLLANRERDNGRPYWGTYW